VAVIAVGNTALSDEGIGSEVVRRVAQEAPPGVAAIDAGLPGLGLISLLEGRDKVVIVDAVDAGGPPGTLYRFHPHEVASARSRPQRSLHQGDILLHLELAETLGMAPREVVIIGIQPRTFAPGQELSAPVAAALDKAVELALAEACGSTDNAAVAAVSASG
jgi:hydrogenase maturation protease